MLTVSYLLVKCQSDVGHNYVFISINTRLLTKSPAAAGQLSVVCLTTVIHQIIDGTVLQDYQLVFFVKILSFYKD